MKSIKSKPKASAAGASKFQKKSIYRLSGYKKDIKEEWVQWATNDPSKISTNDLSFEQANKIIRQAGGTPFANKNAEDNWGTFNNKNGQHRYILSLCRQLNWVINSDKYGKVADLNRLSNFLKSDRSPVKKPLQKMSPAEVSKIITALESIIKSNYEKN